MLGIQEIASYIPPGRISNLEKMEKFGITEDFLENTIGVKQVSVKAPSQKSSDLCLEAYRNLRKKLDFDESEIDILLVVTQNPDRSIPHTSAMVQGKLPGLPDSCACFDISLGCSGYVYALSVIIAMMKENGMKKGLLFTADPYTDIVDFEDKNTSLIFGDAASVSLISESAVCVPGKFTFGTMGRDYKELMLNDEGKLFMNGRAVYNFVAKVIPGDIRNLYQLNGLTSADIDTYIFHQGSRKMIDTLARRLELPPEKVVFDIMNCGNTISSSIPIILEKEIRKKENKIMLISGFGVGLSWASTVLRRIQK